MASARVSLRIQYMNTILFAPYRRVWPLRSLDSTRTKVPLLNAQLAALEGTN
jgi:hypothetical protein